MPVEIIGEVGTPGAEREWIVAECELAMKHLKGVCGEPPLEMELEIQWQEHDLGEYPVIVLTWEDAMRGAPWDYIARCESAMAAYENGGDLPPGRSIPPIVSQDDDEFDEDYWNSETAPEPLEQKAKEPLPTKCADSDAVQRSLARAKNLLLPSLELLKKTPPASKRIH